MPVYFGDEKLQMPRQIMTEPLHSGQVLDENSFAVVTFPGTSPTKRHCRGLKWGELSKLPSGRTESGPSNHHRACRNSRRIRFQISEDWKNNEDEVVKFERTRNGAALSVSASSKPYGPSQIAETFAVVAIRSSECGRLYHVAAIFAAIKG